MAVAPAAVWKALADADTYGDWVVGSKRIRSADAAWPAPGSRFHHTVGVGPLSIDDHTESLEAHPPTLLRMRAKARPFGTAQVTLELTPSDGGTPRMASPCCPSTSSGWPVAASWSMPTRCWTRSPTS